MNQSSIRSLRWVFQKVISKKCWGKWWERKPQSTSSQYSNILQRKEIGALLWETWPTFLNQESKWISPRWGRYTLCSGLTDMLCGLIDSHLIQCIYKLCCHGLLGFWCSDSLQFGQWPPLLADNWAFSCVPALQVLPYFMKQSIFERWQIHHLYCSYKYWSGVECRLTRLLRLYPQEGNSNPMSGVCLGP